MSTKTAKTKKNTTQENVIAMKPDVQTQIEALRTDIALLAEAVKQQATDTVAAKTEGVREQAQIKAENDLNESENAKLKYDELTTKAETQIKEKPLTSIAIALGAGLLLGGILRK
jgi:ElaB/YqjD/DUF883 family membrane-anchored ribosome-binding protein